MSKKAIYPNESKPPRGPYSPAVRTKRLILISGQLPVDPKSGMPVVGGIEEQTEQVLANLAAILSAAGAQMDDVMKTTVYLRDRADWSPMNQVYQRHFGQVPPARSAVVVGEMSHNALVEIEAVAVLPGRIKKLLRGLQQIR